MNHEPTNFIESNALLAVQSGDPQHARELLATMHPNELRELADAAEALAWLARLARQTMVTDLAKAYLALVERDA